MWGGGHKTLLALVLGTWRILQERTSFTFLATVSEGRSKTRCGSPSLFKSVEMLESTCMPVNRV